MMTKVQRVFYKTWIFVLSAASQLDVRRRFDGFGWSSLECIVYGYE